MPGAKHASKRKRWSKAVPVLGAAGLLSLASGALARAAGAAADVTTTSSATHHACTLSEEEVSDVSLATFYVFDKERAGPPAFTLARGCGRCGGCARCAVGRCVVGRCAVGCAGCGGGCGSYCWSMGGCDASC